MDVIREIEATQREVSTRQVPAGEAKVIRMQRTFDASIEDVWDALTDPGRIGRWFLPITGDLRLGGTFQFEGNAGGEILACERPNRLKATWVFGEPDGISEVEIRLTPEGEERTVFDFEHVATVPPEMWEQFGPGAVGTGWDGGMLGLALHLSSGEGVDDPLAWALSDEGRTFNTRSSEAWGEASRAAGMDEETVARNVAATTAFYTTPPDEAPQT